MHIVGHKHNKKNIFFAVLFCLLVFYLTTLLYSANNKNNFNYEGPNMQPLSFSTNNVTQYGITWTFNNIVEAGQFANGDYWVVGPVILVNITPTPTGGRNGFEINPVPGDQQPYDNRVDSYTASLQPNLPVVIQANSSIVSTISNPTQTSCCVGTSWCGWRSPWVGDCSISPLNTAAVLTVLHTAPLNDGATVFRPPYAGSKKPLYSTTSLQTSQLLSLAPVNDTPPLSWVESRFRRVQLDHKVGWTGRYMHPTNNSPDYGALIARDYGDGLLRLQLNDSLAYKTPALINYVQAGIDIYGIIDNGGSFDADGGHSNGRKAPLAFAATILNDPTMALIVRNSTDTFSEDTQVKFDQRANNGNGLALWGTNNSFGLETDYWRNLLDEVQGSKTNRDPYGLIDGGTYPGGGYQECCTTQTYKGPALASYLLASFNSTFNAPQLLQYMDRWTTLGVWAQPDSCAPATGFCVGGAHNGQQCSSATAGTFCTGKSYCNYTSSNLGITFGPNGNGGCILDTNPADGIGRFVERHGLLVDGGLYGSAFASNMWDTYRNLSLQNIPICGDNVCNVTIGENCNTCNSDCGICGTGSNAGSGGGSGGGGGGSGGSTVITQCNDGVDNDGDRLIDYPGDLGCSNAQDNIELDSVATRTNSTEDIVEEEQESFPLVRKNRINFLLWGAIIVFLVVIVFLIILRIRRNRFNQISH